MDTLYILECIAYLAVIPLGPVMTYLFYLETVKKQHDMKLANRQMKMAEDFWSATTY
jgi:hypothetical protein